MDRLVTHGRLRWGAISICRRWLHYSAADDFPDRNLLLPSGTPDNLRFSSSPSSLPQPFLPTYSLPSLPDIRACHSRLFFTICLEFISTHPGNRSGIRQRIPRRGIAPIPFAFPLHLRSVSISFSVPRPFVRSTPRLVESGWLIFTALTGATRPHPLQILLFCMKPIFCVFLRFPSYNSFPVTTLPILFSNFRF